MLRLYLSPNDGVGRIPCPRCGRPLLLGMRRRGYWRIGYLNGFSIRAGGQALLVCPSMDCDHVERASVAETPADAVVYNPWRAAAAFRYEHLDASLTTADIRRIVDDLIQKHQARGNPKIPSLLRFWKNQYWSRYWSLYHPLGQALEHEHEVICVGKDWQERGRVLLLLEQGLLLTRSGSSETVYLSLGTLVSTRQMPEPAKEQRPLHRFDFAGESASVCRVPPGNLPNRYAVINGYSVQLHSISPSGICQVATRNPEAAQALGLWSPNGNWYTGEYPAALLERVYLLVRHAWVHGHRLALVGQSPLGWVRVESRNMETARTLHMRRYAVPLLSRRKGLRWWKEYPLDEVTLEVMEVPIRLSRFLRQVW